MCNACLKDVVDFLQNCSDNLKTATGKDFYFKKLDLENIYVINSLGHKRHFHLKHLVELYHYLKFEGKIIKGVGSGDGSIRDLIGSEGALVSCNLCDRNASYLWGILSELPGVFRGKDNSLKYKL